MRPPGVSDPFRRSHRGLLPPKGTESALLLPRRMSVTLTSNSRVLVTGHKGLVGSAIVRRLAAAGVTDPLVADRDQVDLRDQRAVDDWFERTRPQFVFHVAGKVGGIWANSTQPADFLYDNVMMGATVLRAAWKCGVQKLLYLGSSCIYPRDCPQPIKEEYLLSGPLEKTNDAYAIAKIAGLLACDAYRRQYGARFISAMPTNLYGPNDNFHPEHSHVLPALIRRFHEAKDAGQPRVTIWGSGSPRREFLHVDDLADACLFLMERYDEAGTINVGAGEDVTIRELAETVRDVVHPGAQLDFDRSRPDGTPRKLLDVSRLHALGWRHRTSLTEGIRQTYQWFLERSAQVRG
jgi:GDP-L-fucose synthase